MSKATKKDFISPMIRVGNEKHVFEELFKDGKLPELKSIGFVRVPGKMTYVPYVITSKGKDIINIEVGEPNLRGIAEEASKISFSEQFIGNDL